MSSYKQAFQLLVKYKLFLPPIRTLVFRKKQALKYIQTGGKPKIEANRHLLTNSDKSY